MHNRDDHDCSQQGSPENKVVVVGSQFDDDNGLFAGSAYYFDTAIVGAIFDEDNGVDSGFAYLFDISEPANPVQIFKLLPNDGAAEDNFGFSVAISGPTAIVGAVFDSDNGDISGSAYLFDTATGRQIAKLLPDDGAALDNFGFSVAISGTTAMVGAYLDDDNGSGSGSAYLFDAGAPPCPSDLDGDGNVGASDLLALLVNWGPCL